ncbi:MAG: DUF1998 domain-containing protein, partial [Planctomycetales bacterium]|nr:DUF1998 domain-containing protein [Planctomycetales bacterium]
AGGGAGYVADVGNMLAELIADARTLLNCSCVNACHACLLDFDTQRYADKLDRSGAEAWFGDNYASFFQVPIQFQYFGDASRCESQSVTEAVLRRLSSPGLEKIEIVAAGSGNDWAIDHWDLWRHLAAIAVSGRQINVAVLLPASTAGLLQWQDKHQLVSRCDGLGIDIMAVPEPALVRGNGKLAAKLTYHDKSIEWAIGDFDDLPISEAWGLSGGDAPAIRGTIPTPNPIAGERIELPVLQQQRPNQCEFHIVKGEWNGSMAKLSDRFWKTLRETSSKLNSALATSPVQIEYCDRYLKAPLPAKLLYEIMKPFWDKGIRFRLKTGAAENQRISQYFDHNWEDARIQKSVLQGLFSEGFDLELSVVQRHVDLPHAREMRLTWSNQQTVSIQLDQGMGFARASGSCRFDFSKSATDQIVAIRSINSHLTQLGSSMPLYVISVN